MYILSVDKCKKLDEYTISNIGIPSIVLMENAAEKIINKIKGKADKFLVICGVGNNGGDGLAIARKLILQDKCVEIIIVNEKSKYTNDFNINLNILKNMECSIKYIKTNKDINILDDMLNKFDIIVDCIFGVGLNRNLNDFYINIIKAINNCKAFKVSVDVPSGLNGDTGKEMGEAIRADITYTFEAIKKGFIEYNALEYLGDLEVISIGIPKVVKDMHNEKIVTLSKSEYSNRLNKRSLYGHKGTYGKVAIFAGERGYTGAAYITTESCVKTGTGLTTLISSKYVQDILSTKLVEAMTLDISDEVEVKNILNDLDAIAFGPGLKGSKEALKSLENIIYNAKIPIVIDAEGINILSENRELLNDLNGRAVITPHPGEMARLIGKSIKEVESNRIEIAKRYAKKNNVVLLLKGYNTVITDGNFVYINKTGNSKMASGGMGDCLTGIITSLIAQKHSIFDSAILGAYIHGLAGERAGEHEYSTVATKVIDEIPKVMESILKID